MIRSNKTVSLLALILVMSGAIAASEAQAADPRNGAKLYNMHCSSCHGPKGKGAMPGMPDFTRGPSLAIADDAIVRVLESGKGVMPSFRGLLTPQDMLDVISHLRTFQ